MTDVLAVILAVTCAVILAAALYWLAWLRDRRDEGTWLDGCVRARLRVHTVADGPTIEGLVETVDADGLVLRFATFMGPGGAEYELDGTAWVPRERVLFVQRIGSSPPPS